MAKNITIAGASYTGVPAVNLQQTGGGTAKFVDTSGATVTPDSLLEGFTAYGADGSIKTGTFTINSEVTQQRSLVSDIKAALEGKAAAGGSGVSIEPCTINFRLDSLVSEFPIMYYINPDTMTVETITSAPNTTVTIAAQTIMVLTKTSAMSYMNGNAEQIFYNQGYAAYVVTGNCEYVIME